MNPRVLGVVATVAAVSVLALAVLGVLRPQAGTQASGEAEPVATPVAERPALRPERQATAAPSCATCGVVESVRTFEVTGPGGNGGAEAGKSEPQKRIVYRVTIRMDDGSYRAISQPVAPGYGTGEKVRIIDGQVVPRG